ncbi:MAG: hypothetical protein FJY29_12465 [Betaproteobacteria bacterium]|nr:hypothetical protein [Betaproteobacteria bacterium]
MWMKLFMVAVVSLGSAYAEASCRGLNEGNIRKFVCSDGTVQNISLVDGQIVIKTYNPETKTWSESRFPAADGITLDTVSISVRQGG